jgi:hypothetical protein
VPDTRIEIPARLLPQLTGRLTAEMVKVARRIEKADTPDTAAVHRRQHTAIGRQVEYVLAAAGWAGTYPDAGTVVGIRVVEPCADTVQWVLTRDITDEQIGDDQTVIDAAIGRLDAAIPHRPHIGH